MHLFSFTLWLSMLVCLSRCWHYSQGMSFDLKYIYILYMLLSDTVRLSFVCCCYLPWLCLVFCYSTVYEHTLPFPHLSNWMHIKFSISVNWLLSMCSVQTYLSGKSIEQQPRLRTSLFRHPSFGRCWGREIIESHRRALAPVPIYLESIYNTSIHIYKHYAMPLCTITIYVTEHIHIYIV